MAAEGEGGRVRLINALDAIDSVAACAYCTGLEANWCAQPYQTIAEHFEKWLELASASQFDGRGAHRTPRAFVLPKCFANTSNVAYMRLVLLMPSAATLAKPASSPIAAKAGQTGSDKVSLGWCQWARPDKPSPSPHRLSAQ